MPLCPCGSTLIYEVCCEPFLQHLKVPQTPEQLMRSRYTAYSKADIGYIYKTMKGKPLLNFDEESSKKWAQTVTWIGLQVLNSKLINPELGFVEFIATLIDRNQLKTIQEHSEFHKHDGQWFYVDGSHSRSNAKPNSKIARNTACPCGSGKKFKNCHER